MYKHKMDSCPGIGKQILAQDANVALLVDRAIHHHHQLRFAWCMESTYHNGGADSFIRFLDKTVP